MSRIAIVTGAAGGIGFAICEEFAACGWNVVAVDLRFSRQPAGVAASFVVDVSDPESVQGFYAEIAASGDTVDTLVNNAAVQVTKRLVDTTPVEWDRVMAVNVRGPYLMVKYAHPLMTEHGGAVINISSVHARATSVGIGAYAASKGALATMTRTMALELAPDNIRVNAILPGAIDTPMLSAGMERSLSPEQTAAERLAVLAGRHPLGRIGEPADVARCAMFLADPAASSYITGQEFVLDGGALARLSTED